MPTVQWALQLSDGSRPPSVTRIHRKVFVRWISGLHVYKDSVSGNYKKKKGDVRKKKMPRVVWHARSVLLWHEPFGRGCGAAL